MSLRKILVSATVASIVATSVFASCDTYSPCTGTIAQELDQNGDYLLFPAYYANTAGWKTNVRVVNTNTTASVVAKVVIREGKNSIEMRDFAIYLSPGDVWDAMIANDGSNISITSSDDSMIIGDVLGSESTHVINFPTKSFTEPTKGYIEVFGMAKTSRDVLGKAPVDKHILYADYKNDFSLHNSPDESQVGVDWVPVGQDDLAGEAIILADNEVGQMAMTYPATAYKNATGDKVGDPLQNAIGADTRLFNLTSKCTVFGTCDVWVNEMENALDKAETYVVNYSDAAGAVNNTQLISTFSTKKYRTPKTGATEVTAAMEVQHLFYQKDASLVQDAAHPYSLSGDFYVKYGPLARDMQEHYPTTPGKEISGDDTQIVEHTCDWELCQINVKDLTTYSDGYVSFRFYGDDNTTSADDKINPMPYDARVMVAKDVGGKNITNIYTPSYRTTAQSKQ